MTLPPLPRAMRPHQWTKNLFVFAGAVFSLNLGHPEAVLRAVTAFVVFCALASAAYLANDVRDREEDARHPIKRRRPIASGQLSVRTALAAAAGLTALGLAAALSLRSSAFLALAGAYVVETFLYSRWLKRMVVLDVMTVAVGFVLRAAAGAVAVDAAISPWLLLCTFLLSLVLAIGKRSGELALARREGSALPPHLDAYTPELLSLMVVVAASATVVSYALYTMSPRTVGFFHTEALVYTTTFVIYGIFRYLWLVQRHGRGEPSDVVLTDRPLQVNVALWLCAVIAIVYWSRP